MTSVEIKVKKNDTGSEDQQNAAEALDKELAEVVKKMDKIKEALYGTADTNDPQILNHIELWSNSGAVDLTVLKKYVKNLENASTNEIEVKFREFVDNHNKVLFGHILPQLELLNELYRLINVADRKLGESDRVKVIGRINEMVNNVRPTLGNWLSIQKDLQSRLKYELDLASAKKPTFRSEKEAKAKEAAATEAKSYTNPFEGFLEDENKGDRKGGGKLLAHDTNWKDGWAGLHVDADSPVRHATADLNSKLFGDQMFYDENGEWGPNDGKLKLPSHNGVDLDLIKQPKAQPKAKQTDSVIELGGKRTAKRTAKRVAKRVAKKTVKLTGSSKK